MITDVEILKQISQPVEEVDSEFWLEMQKILRDNRAVGLSAIQLGKPIRAFVIQVKYNHFEMFQNPTITGLEGKLIYPNEMCLSFPGLKVNTNRFSKCIVNDKFHENVVCTGIMSIAVQHEMDHFQGRCINDHFSPAQRIIYENRIKRIK